ncbi:MAG: AIR synthase-related protein [Microgenomates group bacterium]
MLNGETAELSYRTSGFGPSRVNWNATGLYLINEAKLILGTGLKPGQKIMGWREKSIRSNGLSKARGILEAAYLFNQGYPSKEAYFLEHLADHLKEKGMISSSINRDLMSDFRDGKTIPFLNELMGHNFLEQVLVPWHELDSKIVEEVLRPSNLYGRVMYDALGGIDGEKEVNIISAAHISGGGIPEKVKRMLEVKKLGAHIEPVFEDPKAVSMLMELAEKHLPEEQSKKMIDQRRACEQWNRGLGFVAVVENNEDADRLTVIGSKYGVEIAQVGEILPDPKIEWRGHTWTY